MKELLAAVLIPPGENIPQADANTIFNGAIGGAFFLAGIIAVLMIVINAYRFITSSGDTGAVSKAKEGLKYSIVGLIVVLISFAAVRFVADAVGG